MCSAKNTLYDIEGIASISVSDAFELQDKNYMIGKVTAYNVPNTTLVFQQPGVNNHEAKSKTTYCRLMVACYKGEYGDYPNCDDDSYFTPDLLEQMSDNVYYSFTSTIGKLAKYMKIIDYPKTEVATMTGGYKGLRTIYIRTGDRGNVKVIVNYFYNSSQCISITESYLIADSAYWVPLLSEAVASFKWKDPVWHDYNNSYVASEASQNDSNLQSRNMFVLLIGLMTIVCMGLFLILKKFDRREKDSKEGTSEPPARQETIPADKSKAHKPMPRGSFMAEVKPPYINSEPKKKEEELSLQEKFSVSEPLAILPQEAQPQEEHEKQKTEAARICAEDGPAIYCPGCGHKVDVVGAKFCKYCGYKLI